MHLRIDVTPPNGQQSHSINVEQDRALVGRATFSEVRLPFPIVSSRHLELERRQGRWFLRDVGSSNGTYIEGSRIQPGDWLQITDGMEALIAGLRMRFNYVREANVGLTLAQSGTLVRRLVQEAASKVVDDEAAFIEAIEGPGTGNRVYLPDDLESTRIGHGAERPLAGVTPPIVIGRDDDRFTVEEGPISVNDQPFEGSWTLESSDRIRVGNTVLVFFDPLEELLDDWGGTKANKPQKVVETKTGDVPSMPRNDSGATGGTGAIAAPSAAQPAVDTGAVPVADSTSSAGGDTGAIPSADLTEAEQGEGDETEKEERGLSVAEIALIGFALLAFVVAGIVLWALFA